MDNCGKNSNGKGGRSTPSVVGVSVKNKWEERCSKDFGTVGKGWGGLSATERLGQSN